MTFDLIKLAVFVIFAVPASIQDIKKLRFSLIWPAGCLAALFTLHLYFSMPLTSPLLGMGISLAIYTLTWLVTADTLGTGDIIFGTAAGFYSSFPNGPVSIFIAALCGIFFYVFIIKKNRPVFAIPFVPFIAAGAVLVELITGHIIVY